MSQVSTHSKKKYKQGFFSYYYMFCELPLKYYLKKFFSSQKAICPYLEHIVLEAVK